MLYASIIYNIRVSITIGWSDVKVTIVSPVLKYESTAFRRVTPLYDFNSRAKFHMDRRNRAQYLSILHEGSSESWAHTKY